MSTKFTALTIREGDAFLLEDNGKNCLFDSGVDDLIVDLLQYKGIDKLDLAICSHNDADHANGFIALLGSSIRIEEIWLPYWWASILQYANDYPIDWKEIGYFDEDLKNIVKEGYEPELLFSDEPPRVSFNDLIKTTISLAEQSDYEKQQYEESNYHRAYCLAYNIVYRLVDELNNRINPDDVVSIVNDVANRLCINEADSVSHEVTNRKVYKVADRVSRKVAERVIHKTIDYKDIEIDHMVFDVTCNLLRYFGKELPRNLNTHIEYFCNRYLDNNFFIYHKESNHVKDLKIKLDAIMEIVKRAYQRNCRIRWFEPQSTCVDDKIDYGFVALNSHEKRFHDKKLMDLKAFAFALTLTKENKYSLAFEYYYKGTIPIVRFSADSDCEHQTMPYKENIIVTAPHHGSKANANVYKAIQGDDIIWVRSDSLCGTRGRPYDTFKLKKNKYCLACEKYNFISEICFEYNPSLKLWCNINGERCRCNP